jgi:aspartyl-tRNA(Asn)/glutamyl-tRNA(Gln) amidotransferase subunit A
MPEGLLDELTAVQAARAIAARGISPVELVEALLARASAVDGKLLAWEALDGRRALETARSAERAVANRVPLGPLHGVPFGVKDIFDTAGLRTAAGFRPYDSRVPERDAALVSRLKAAGGIVLGKTVATQFAFTDPSRTRNPWRADRTPGGSSSGSGAAVAAREVPVALGSQTAGSTLRPAAYCGAVGFKPTMHRLPLGGAFPLAWSLDHAGIIARSVADCGLFLLAAEGPDEPVTPARLPSAERAQTAGPPRLALVIDAIDAATAETAAHVHAVALQLESAGAELVELHLGSALDLVLAVHRVILNAEAAAAHRRTLAQHEGDLHPILRATARVGQMISSSDYLHAQRLRHRIAQEWQAHLAGVDAMLMPTATAVAPGPETTGDPSLQMPATLIGLPSISLPSGLSDERLPHAVQLVGRRGADEQLLDVAAWCEARLPHLHAPTI